jgi:hypothetical protein
MRSPFRIPAELAGEISMPRIAISRCRRWPAVQAKSNLLRLVMGMPWEARQGISRLAEAIRLIRGLMRFRTQSSPSSHGVHNLTVNFVRPLCTLCS